MRLQNPTRPPGVRVRGVQPHQIAIRNISYNFGFMNSPSKWVTMAPEGHGAQVLLDPDLGSKKVTYPYYIGGALQLLFYKVFAKMHSWGSKVLPDSLYAPHTRGWGVPGQNTPKNLPPSRTTSVRNFIPIHQAVWTDTLTSTLPFMY